MRRGWRLAAVAAGLAAVGGAARWGLARVSVSVEASEPLPHRYSAGALMLCGGGALPPEVRDHFVALAGGREAHLVVIPSGHRSIDNPAPGQWESYLEPWRSRGAASVRMLHAKTRADAESPGVASVLDGATGVWISGGSQTRLAEIYRGTAVERRMAALLARGGVVGGTSAGAGVMTQVMIAGGRAEADVGEGLDLLPGAVVDQHFLRRNRLGRLLGVVKSRLGLVGLGVDEDTALVVDLRTRRARVEGKSYVVACVADPPALPPDDAGVVPVRTEALKAGDEIDLAAFAAQAARPIAAAFDLDGR